MIKLSRSTLRRTGGGFGLAIALAGARCAPYEGFEGPDPQGDPASRATANELAVTSDAVPPPAPPLVLSPADLAKFTSLPARPDAIPVLLFHGICATTCAGDDPLQLPRA